MLSLALKSNWQKVGRRVLAARFTFLRGRNNCMLLNTLLFRSGSVMRRIGSYWEISGTADARAMPCTDLAQETAFTAEGDRFSDSGLARPALRQTDLNQLWNDGHGSQKPCGLLRIALGRWKRCWDDGWEGLNARRLRSVADIAAAWEERYAPDDPFTSLIGYDRGLRDAVKRPCGALSARLHVLLYRAVRRR